MGKIPEAGLISGNSLTQYKKLNSVNLQKDLIKSVIYQGLAHQIETNDGINEVPKGNLVDDTIRYPEREINLLFRISQHMNDTEWSDFKSAVIISGVERITHS